MTAGFPDSALALRSTVTSQGTLELSLLDVPVPTPGPNEVLVRVEAAPINPSDLGVLIPGADMTTATVEGAPDRPVVTASLGAGALAGLSARIDKPLPVGNEGAGTVVAAGQSSAAQALLGKTVGIAGGGMYTQYRVVDAAACLVLPSGATAKDGASSFVNPLTALGMLETMRREGHSGLVHTAAASNLGQMLVKLCIADGCRSSTSSASLTKRNCCARWARYTSAAQHRRRSRQISSKLSKRRLRRLRSTPPVEERWQVRSSTVWRKRPIRPRRSTRAMGRPSTSRRISTADSIPVRPSSPGTSAWHGVLAGGCSPRSSRTPATRSFADCEPGWLRSSPPRLRAPTPVRFPLPACCGLMRSTATSSGRPGRNSSSPRKRSQPRKKQAIASVRHLPLLERPVRIRTERLLRCWSGSPRRWKCGTRRWSDSPDRCRMAPILTLPTCWLPRVEP